jgi:hypothetical protein
MRLFNVCAIALAVGLPSVITPNAAPAGDQVNAPQWELLGVATDMKPITKLIFGRVVIKVDSDDPRETLAAATLVARKLIKDRTLGALQVWAYPRSFPRTDRDTAWVEYSTDPDFMAGTKWIYRVASQVGLTPQITEFDPESVRMIGTVKDPTEVITSACKGAFKNCSVGKTTL